MGSCVADWDTICSAGVADLEELLFNQSALTHYFAPMLCPTWTIFRQRFNKWMEEESPEDVGAPGEKGEAPAEDAPQADGQQTAGQE